MKEQCEWEAESLELGISESLLAIKNDLSFFSFEKCDITSSISQDRTIIVLTYIEE